MSFLLFKKSNNIFCYFNEPQLIGTLYTKENILGDKYQIENVLSANYYAGGFRCREIQRNPAQWAAYTLYLMLFKFTITYPKELFLIELLNSIEPNIWIQNKDIISLLLQCLMKYSSQL